MSTFVTVGNAKQEFGRLFDICAECYKDLNKPVIIQSGYTDVKHNFDEIYKFMSQTDFHHSMKNASLVIGHAGAGTIMTALQYGKKPIVIPRLSAQGEHVDDHQTELAKALESEGKVFMVNSSSELHSLLKERVDYRYLPGEQSNRLLEEVKKDIIRLGSK